MNSVIKAESGFNVRAVSPKGAQGLMQLMPGTASQLGVPNAFDPQANVEGGTKYLRELLERYNFDLVKALAAYNAGPQRVEQFGGVPPYYETRAYVARIVRDFNKKKAAQEKAAVASADEGQRFQDAGAKKSTASGAGEGHSSLAPAKSWFVAHELFSEHMAVARHRQRSNAVSAFASTDSRRRSVSTWVFWFDPYGSLIYLGWCRFPLRVAGPRRGVFPLHG